MDRIMSFPNDSRLWWVRWVDRVRLPMGGTGSPGVFVLLSRLDDDLGLNNLDHLPTLESQGRRSNVARQTCEALAGAIPGLAIGTVFWNGWRVGALKAQDIPLTLTAGSHKPSVCEADAPGPVPAPWWWTPAIPYGVLPGTRYRLHDFHRSNCLVAHDARSIVVIPCFEALRAFYAPHEGIARALLSGPWDERLHEVVNPERTVPVPGREEWMVVLRQNIENRHKVVLGNLVLNPWGKREANNIYTALLRQKSSGSGILRVALPFDWDRLTIKARCIRLHTNPDKYFAFEVTEIIWPDPPLGPPPVAYDRDNSNSQGVNQTPIDLPKPYAHPAREVVAEQDGTVPVTMSEDPGARPPPVLFEVRGPVWRNEPPTRKAEKGESYIYGTPPEKIDGEPASEASPGNPGRGTSGAARASYSAMPRPRPSHRLTAVVEMLTRLKGVGGIQDWTVVHPPRNGIEFRDGLWAWSLAPAKRRKRAWYNLGGADERGRGALVCEVNVNGVMTYWLEIETRPKGTRPTEEAFRALLFRIGLYDRMATISKLLEIAVKESGVWRESAILNDAGADPHRKWQHRYEKDNSARLSAENALADLRFVATAPARRKIASRQ